jgi:signal transduction histidine kinase
MKKRSGVFLFGGVILGIMAVIPIVSIGAALVGNLKMKILLLPTIILSLTVFGLIQFIVSRKKYQSLKNFYLMAAVVSLGLLIIITRFLLDVAQGPLRKIVSMFDDNTGTVISAVIIYTLITVGIFVFALIFTAITRQKSKYIRYITDEVRKIAESGDNIRIEETGSDELAVLSRSINQMNADLQENKRKQLAAERQKNELISNVSHDLRSPLTSIIGYVQLLKAYSDRNDEKFSEYIEVTDRRLNGLHKLINELFELTKMDSPGFHLNLENGDVTSFVKQFGYEMTILLRQSELNLLCAIENQSFETAVDFERLARVMQNLFSNVEKYAAPKTDILFESKITDGRMHIMLSNTVADASMIDTETMFDRFYRADEARSDADSAGLGLAIAKRIVELHDGEIFAKTDGEILTVTVILPQKKLQSKS